MYCNSKEDNCNRCKFNLKNFGVYDLKRVTIDGSDRTQLNWSEISVPEILPIPCQKPDIEQLDQVFVDAKLTSVKLIETPFAYKIYDRPATDSEINLARNIIEAISTVNNDLAQVIIDADAVLAVPPSAVPELATFQQDRNDVAASDLAINAKRLSLEALLNVPCLCAENILTFNESLEDATDLLELLKVRLDNLEAAGADLEAASTTDVSAEIATMNASIATTIMSTNTAIELTEAGVPIVKKIKYLEIIENEEGTCLTGRKLVIEGVLSQKVLYTALVTTQSVHSAHYEVPFTAYIIPYAKFDGLVYEEDVEAITAKTDTGCETKIINGFGYNPGESIEADIFEEFSVDVYIEDIFAIMLDCRSVFKNITLFFLAKPILPC